jgi:hypothetical protein
VRQASGAMVVSMPNSVSVVKTFIVVLSMWFFLWVVIACT